MAIINLTETASQKVQQLMERDGRDGFALRLKVVGGGCSGLQYQLMFDNQVGELDQEEEEHGVRVVVDPKSAVYLLGTTIDYVDDPFGGSSGFQIDNPSSPWTDPKGQAIQELIETRINPAVAGHGGHVELIDVKDNVVYILLGGGCQGCGMVDVTLKQGIEVMIKEAVPEIHEVIDTTDHAGGSNPYYQPAKGGESPLAP